MVNKSNKKYLVKIGLLLFLISMIFIAGGPAFADTTMVKVIPGQVSGDCQTVTAEVTIEGFPQGQILNGVNIALLYDSTILKYKSVQTGNYFPGFMWMPENSSEAGKVVFSAMNLSSAVPAATSGTVLTVTFDILANGTANVIPEQANVNLTTNQDSDLPVTVQGGSINVTCKPVPATPVVKVVQGQVSNDCTTVTTEVTVEGFPQGQVLDGVNITLQYDSTILKYKGVQPGSYFPGFMWMPEDSSEAGKVVFSAMNLNSAVPATTSGTVLTVTFDILANGTARVIPDQDSVNLTPAGGSDLPVTVQGTDIIITCVAALPVAPSVQTGDASKTTTTAELNGTIVANNGSPITDYGFYWGTDQANLTQQSAGNNDLIGAFNLGLINLTPDTKYYYQAYATNAGGTTLGELKNFTTDEIPAPIAPTVQTGDASKTTNTAVLNGTIVANNGSPITDYGFNWGTDQANLNTQSVGNNDLSGAFTLSLNNLTPETKYYYQAYATNAGGTSLGEMKEFTTDKVIPPALEVTVTLSEEHGISNERPLTISGATNPATAVDWYVEVKDNHGHIVFTSTPPAGTAFSGVVYQPELPIVADGYTVIVTATPAEGEPVIVTKTFKVSNFNYYIHDLDVNGSGASRTVVAGLYKRGDTEPQVQGICQVLSSTGKVVFLKIGEPEEFAADSDNTIEYQLPALEDGTYTVQFFLWIKDGANWKVLSEPATVNFTVGEAQ